MFPTQGGPPPALAPAQAPTNAQQQQPQQQQQQYNFQQQQQQQQYYLQQQQQQQQQHQQHVAACQNAQEVQYQQYYQQQQQQAAAATPPFSAQMAGAAAASAYYQPQPLPQPLGPASAGLPGMHQQQPQTSAGLQPQLMAALNACQHAATSSPAQQWPQNLQQAGLPPKRGKPPGSKSHHIRTVVFKRGKDGLQGKSLAQSCNSFDTCFLFQRDMAKNGSTSISRVRAEPQPLGLHLIATDLARLSLMAFLAPL